MQKNLLTRAQENFWYWYIAWAANRQQEPAAGEYDWARELSNHAFLHGARWCSSMQGKLSPFIAQFIEMMILLGWFDDDGYRIAVPLPDIEPPY